MTDAYGFTEPAARKIVDHVRRHESRPDFEPTYNPRRQRLAHMVYGKAVEAIAKGATGDVNIYTRGDTVTGTQRDKGDEIESGQTVSAYARLGAVDAGNWVYLLWIGGGWEIVNAEC